MKTICTRAILFFVSSLFLSCATFDLQQSEEFAPSRTDKVPSYTFFIAGGLGNISEADTLPIMENLRNQLSSAGENSTLVFTGDNVSEDEENWSSDKALLDRQIALADNFEGDVVFIPGNNEWKEKNSDEVEEFENYIKDLDKDKINFFPENACPIERRLINDNLLLVLVDSKWFISNWSRVKNINKKCTDIVTRTRFVEELEDAIDDNLDKNIVIAMHHPMFSNGQYAGYKTFKQHMTPFPVIGTLAEGFMDLGAFDPEHLNSRRYNYLRIAVTSQAQKSDRITIVSGHEENLQYLVGKEVHQIISGSLGTKTATKLSKDELVSIGGALPFEGKFTYSNLGFAKLTYFEDGSSEVTFYSADNLEKGFTMPIMPDFPKWEVIADFGSTNKKKETAQVFDNPEEYRKSNFYKFLWGQRYRKYLGTPVTAPVVMLDTLYGGLKITKIGGGHQSFSLRLEDEDGREYAMRSLRKSALKYLKYRLPGISYNEEDYKDSWPEEVISDFFTTAHPYMQTIINPLAKSVGINHSDTELFYVPRQEVLGQYNKDFGDELYFIERRPSEEQANHKGYRRVIDDEGKVTDMESTTDMLEKIKSDESYVVDQESYVRARVFDMLIGDWDRHQDQWRWMEYEGDDGIREFMPIPRDRDNVFPRFDGFTMKLVKMFVPYARRWETYDDDIDSVKWLNLSGSKLDRAVVTDLDVEDWVAEAKAIQQQMDKSAVEAAFSKLPTEIQDSTSAQIKRSLLERLKTLDEDVRSYATYLNKVVAIKATEKDDKIEVIREGNHKTTVVIRRILTDEPNPEIYRRTFDDSLTKEIWVYGLGDDDVFEVKGFENNTIRIRIVGGYGEDVYDIENKKKIKVYDWKHEKLDFKAEKPAKQLTNLYTTNTFHWRYFKPNHNVLAPNLGFRTDDGVFLGLTDRYTKNGLNGAPFRQQHTLKASYYFSFAALDLQYDGVFANVIPNWDFEMGAYYSNDRYVKNFFGLGNETINNEDQLDIDYYRGRVRQFKSYVGLAYYHLRPRLLFESFKVKEIPNRFFNSQNLNESAFENQNYVGAEVSGHYDRDNAGDFPTKAMYVGLTAGYKANLNIKDNRFGYASIKMGFDHQLISSGDLVFSTMAEYKTNIGNGNYFFYHAPSIGGNNGLRGFRDQRFSGRSYFYQNTDLKLRLKQYVTAFTPVTLGIYGGFDYGRVWVKNDTSNIWHTSQGGGLWISGLKSLVFRVGYFNSKENNMLQIGFDVSF